MKNITKKLSALTLSLGLLATTGAITNINAATETYHQDGFATQAEAEAYAKGYEADKKEVTYTINEVKDYVSGVTAEQVDEKGYHFDEDGNIIITGGLETITIDLSDNEYETYCVEPGDSFTYKVKIKNASGDDYTVTSYEHTDADLQHYDSNGIKEFDPSYVINRLHNTSSWRRGNNDGLTDHYGSPTMQALLEKAHAQDESITEFTKTQYTTKVITPESYVLEEYEIQEGDTVKTVTYKPSATKNTVNTIYKYATYSAVEEAYDETKTYSTSTVSASSANVGKSYRKVANYTAEPYELAEGQKPNYSNYTEAAIQSTYCKSSYANKIMKAKDTGNVYIITANYKYYTITENLIGTYKVKKIEKVTEQIENPNYIGKWVNEETVLAYYNEVNGTEYTSLYDAWNYNFYNRCWELTYADDWSAFDMSANAEIETAVNGVIDGDNTDNAYQMSTWGWNDKLVITANEKEVITYAADVTVSDKEEPTNIEEEKDPKDPTPTKPSKPEKKPEPKNTEEETVTTEKVGVETGDASNVNLYTGLLVISAAGVVALRKTKKSEE